MCWLMRNWLKLVIESLRAEEKFPNHIACRIVQLPMGPLHNPLEKKTYISKLNKFPFLVARKMKIDIWLSGVIESLFSLSHHSPWRRFAWYQFVLNDKTKLLDRIKSLKKEAIEQNWLGESFMKINGNWSSWIMWQRLFTGEEEKLTFWFAHFKLPWAIWFTQE